jgi:hypothetical protein
MIAQFALRLLCGISLTWVLMPREKVASGFFRIQMLLALALSALAALTMSDFAGSDGQQGPILPIGLARYSCGALAAVTYLGSVFWTLNRRRAGSACIYLVAAGSLAVLLLSSLTRELLPTAIGILTVVSEISTALLIGVATTGMLLGHWYLTAPTMSITPLARVNAYFGSASVLRFVASAIGLAIAWRSLGGGTPLVWLSLRWLAGILCPAVLAAMVWRILRYRNTQAATGVLFVGVIVTFIGELSATLASRELHVPL